jgi:DNA repair exonuclease SbcCD ATPase subunit
MLYTTSTSRISEISKMLETCVNLPSEKEHAKLKTLVMNLAEETTEKVDEHSDLVTRLNDAEKLERAYKLSHHLAQKTKLLKETEHKMKQSQNLIRGAESLQTIAVKAELTTLNHTIRVLNDTAAIYLSEMFDDPIDIRFSTTKELKSGKEKAQVAVKCCYKGSVYDNIEQLSGGERQRANLAFLLAVCQMVGTPILLLDECLNSLDGETHLSIVDHIKRFSMEHLVIVVSHEAIEGKFDNNVIYL